MTHSHHLMLIGLIWHFMPVAVICYLHSSKITSISRIEYRILRNSVSCSFKINDHDTNVLKTHIDPNIIIPSPKLLEYQVRPASFHELGVVSKLRMLVFYPQCLEASSFQKTIDKLKQRVDAGSICLVAKADDLLNIRHLPQFIYFNNLIGTIEISPNDFYNTTMEHIGSSRKLYAADLVVREDFRRQGVASRLLQEIESFAVDHDYDEIYLHVDIGNVVARNLYLQHGYIEVPIDENTVEFAQARMPKPAELYCFLCKQLWSNASSNK